MNGREDWEKFATENGLTWEEGPPKRFDQHGVEYDTYIWDGSADKLKRWLSQEKHIIIRMFPHKDPKTGLSRMRFTSYQTKPT